jgi:hypothetical protein
MTNPSVITDRVLSEILAERIDQDTKWGEQNHPDGTALLGSKANADQARQICQRAARADEVTWNHILTEEFLEAMAEDNPGRLRAELVQIAAVAVAWVEAIDRRHAPANGLPPTGHCTKHTGADRQLYGCSGPDLADA